MKRAAIPVAFALLAVASRAGAEDWVQPDRGVLMSGTPHAMARLGAVASYRGLYDLSMLGGGLALSVGFETDRGAIMFNVRFIDARTLAGLEVLTAGGSVTLEWRLSPGWRVGGGIGTEYMDVHRATGPQDLQSMGPLLLARAVYDFDSRPNVYVLLDLEAQVQATNAYPWGPTLQVGLRF